jgi:ribosomal protein S18 acetylase RimI-like enzyme
MACREFLAKNPVDNVLPLGDTYPPLLNVSDLYCAIRESGVVGACSVYHAYSMPSLVLGTATVNTKRALIEKAMNAISKDFISLCTLDEVDLLKEHASILHSYPEQQMTANPPKPTRCKSVEVMKVSENELESLSRFYAEHHSEAWTPIQFKAGPYYCVKQEGKIVSAAGVHLVTPQIAQLGNIITDEAYRNRGFGTACTGTLAANLATEGRIISLFVRTDNAPAIHMYEKLGFSKTRDIMFLILRKKHQ